MAYEWAPEEYERLPPIVQEGRRLLEDWYRAMEAGEVKRRMPDPLYPAKIDMKVADQIVEHIDREFDKELRAWAEKEASGGYTDGPGFLRLEPAQRLALAQQLHALKQKFKQATPPVKSDATIQAQPGSVPFSVGVSLTR